jgi:hypothetical protein
VIRFAPILALLLVACSGGRPSQPYQLGNLLLDEDFSDPLAWEQYSDPSVQVDGRIVDGVYRIEARDGGFMWALNAALHTDVVIEVETQQHSDYPDNAYGVMCRADPDLDGDGYYFFISGDGYYTIRRGQGDVVADLIQWTGSSDIQTGQARNRVRVVCVGDYLALFVNDTFIAEYRDTLYSRGVTGLTAAVPEGGDVVVTFDNLLIFAATAQ